MEKRKSPPPIRHVRAPAFQTPPDSCDTHVSPRIAPAFKGPERRNIYRALQQKEGKAQIRLNRDGGLRR